MTLRLVSFLVLGMSAASAFAVDVPGGSFEEATPFAWHAGAGAMIGKTGNSTNTPVRNMIYTPGDIFVGYRRKRLRIGVDFQYEVYGQTDDPASFSNQNLEGTSLSAGLEAQYFFSLRWGMGLKYTAWNKLSLDTSAANGQSFSYINGTGWTLKLIRNFAIFSLYASITRDQFPQSDSGGVAALTSPLVSTCYGVGFIVGNMVPMHTTSGPIPRLYPGEKYTDPF